MIKKYDLTSIDENSAKICERNCKRLRKVLNAIKNMEDIVIHENRKESKILASLNSFNGKKFTKILISF